MADEITIKRHDTLDPFSGTVRENGVRVDLSQFATIELHYKLKTAPTTVIKLPVVDVLAADGAGGPNEPDGFPPNYGKWRAVRADVDVSVEGIYEMELECIVTGGGKVHFPNARALNPTLNIDPDEDDA